MPKLLLADDSITIQKVVELVLAEEGFEIHSVGNGEDALSAIPSFKPDIVLADIEMPRMNGYALCDRIKKNPETAQIPVILLAGAFEPVDEELAKNVGSVSFLIKPFESEDLINAINAAISGKPARVEEEAIATFDRDEEIAAPWEEEAGPGEFEEEEEAVEAVAEEAGDLWEAEAVEAEALEEGEEAIEAVEAVEAVEEAGDLWEAEVVEAEAVEEGEEALEAVEAVEAIEETAEMEEAAAPAGVEEAVEAPVDEEAVAEAEEPPPMPIPTEAIERAAQFEESAPIIETEAARPRPAMPDAAQMAEVFAQVARENMGKFIAQLNLKAEIEKDIRQTVENVLWEIAPDMVDRILKQSLLKEVEKVVWETVPDLAENIIEREVKKLKSEI